MTMLKLYADMSTLNLNLNIDRQRLKFILNRKAMDAKTSLKPLRGSITLILACMYAGKTTELERQFRRAGVAKRKCIMVTYTEDTRYSPMNEVVTHDGLAVKCLKCYKLATILDILREYDVICIDEVQFIEDAPQILNELANVGKTIFAAGLNGTFERQTFPVIAQLLALSEELIKLDAICMGCGATANFSYKVQSDTGSSVKDIHAQYIPLCRQCFNAKHK
jgi:thymidine kinase